MLLFCSRQGVVKKQQQHSFDISLGFKDAWFLGVVLQRRILRAREMQQRLYAGVPSRLRLRVLWG